MNKLLRADKPSIGSAIPPAFHSQSDACAYASASVSQRMQHVMEIVSSSMGHPSGKDKHYLQALKNSFDK